jgi:hypothetical protein
LFRIVNEFIKLELKLLKEKCSSKAFADNKIFTLRGLLNSILNNVNSRGQCYLNVNLFYETIVYFFEKREYEHALISVDQVLIDISMFFTQHFINLHKYCCELKKFEWLKLLNIFIKCYQSSRSKSSITCITSIRCICGIISKCYTYIGTFDLSQLFTFFECSISNINKDTNSEIVENLIEIVSTFIANYCCESFENICHFVEEITLKLIELFKLQDSTSHNQIKMKKNILNIWICQLVLVNKFNYSISKSILIDLFDHMINEIHYFSHQILNMSEKR